MSDRFAFDSEDPFGTRPDEKPPEGWDSRFWDEVRERIRQREDEPGSGRLPEPLRREGPSGRTMMVMAMAMVAMAVAVFGTGPGSHPRPEAPPESGPRGDDVSRTVVLVSGSADPVVSVEWARSGGRRSGYIVFESLTPEISYVVIDRRPPAHE